MGAKQIMQLAAIVAIAILMMESPVACDTTVIDNDDGGGLTSGMDGNEEAEEQLYPDNINKLHSHTEGQRAWGTAESGSDKDDGDSAWDSESKVPDIDQDSTSQGTWGLADPESPELTKHILRSKETDETVKETRAWGAASEATTIEDIIGAEETQRQGSELNVPKNRSVVVDNKEQKDTKRAWGAGLADHEKNSSHETKYKPETQNVHGVSSSESSATDDSSSASHIPFVATKHLHHHNPPEGYSLAARVYIDTKDKLAHFDYTEGQRITFPYWDCGAAGSTTSPIPLKNAYFRHSLATPTSWSSSDSSDALNPVLVVALSPFVMELNSGETMEFHVGDVVLLEDCLRPGHRMRPLPSGGPNNLRALFLTLPQQHYHIGKQHFSLKKAVMRSQAPCEIIQVDNGLPEIEPFVGVVPPETTKTIAPDISAMVQQPFQANFWDGRRIRMLILGTIGLSLSTLAADFLGKTAPLWLAVGIGGTCFVAGSTYTIAMAGDYILTQLQLWFERRRLESNQSNVKNEENLEEDIVVPMEGERQTS